MSFFFFCGRIRSKALYIQKYEGLETVTVHVLLLMVAHYYMYSGMQKMLSTVLLLEEIVVAYLFTKITTF